MFTSSFNASFPFQKIIATLQHEKSGGVIVYNLPKSLVEGSTIGVIAPASAAKRKFVKQGVEYLKEKGYKVKIAPNLSRGKFYLAGDDNLRIKLLEEFFLNPEVDGIICVRGGYGTLRILCKISFEKLSSVPPKVFVGYSDITALQLAMLKKLGWITYSGPMVASEMGQNISEFSEEWLWKMISEVPYPIELVNPEDQPLDIFKHGTGEGKLIGGCLSLITPLLGTEYMPSLENAILVIEDIDEKTYRLDKHFQLLELHGVFDKISGLIVGQFVKCFPKNPNRSFTLNDYLADVLSERNIPVLTNFAYGHINRRFTLPIGINAKITTSPPKIELLGI